MSLGVHKLVIIYVHMIVIIYVCLIVIIYLDMILWEVLGKQDLDVSVTSVWQKRGDMGDQLLDSEQSWDVRDQLLHDQLGDVPITA